MTSQGHANISVTVLRSSAELHPVLGELQDLAASAIEPNVFYEPWMLVPALKWLPPNGKLCLALVYMNTAGVEPKERLLIGFFPLEVRRGYNHFPVRTASLWRHKFCYLCVPLLRRESAREALDAFLEWFSAKGCECSILAFGWAAGEGKVHDLLVERLWTTGRANLVDVRWTRPCLQRAPTAEAYLEQAISSRHRKDLEKKERKLRQLGKAEYASPTTAEERAEWIEQFIRLEANGWRGKRGVACSSQPSDTAFFEEAMKESERLGRLDMIGLRLNSQLIAIKINLSCADGSFAFMITYDEQYSAYSPGFLLEIENIRRLHGTRSIAWMDSCADQNSPLFTRAWTERRTIETLLVSSGSRRGDFWIGAIPFGHFLRRLLLPKSAKKDSGALSPTRARSRHVFPKQATSSAAGSDEQLHAVGACSKE